MSSIKASSLAAASQSGDRVPELEAALESDVMKASLIVALAAALACSDRSAARQTAETRPAAAETESVASRPQPTNTAEAGAANSASGKAELAAGSASGASLPEEVVRALASGGDAARRMFADGAKVSVDEDGKKREFDRVESLLNHLAGHRVVEMKTRSCGEDGCCTLEPEHDGEHIGAQITEICFSPGANGRSYPRSLRIHHAN
jgi:hypothetical protein